MDSAKLRTMDNAGMNGGGVAKINKTPRKGADSGGGFHYNLNNKSVIIQQKATVHHVS